MFTGIIQKIGVLQAMQTRGSGAKLQISLSTPWKTPLEAGESIAIQGACLTLTQWDATETHLTFDVLHETLEKTNLPQKKNGDPLNIERALHMGDALGGHLVSGHVDGIGILRKITPAGKDRILEIQAGKELSTDLIPKGSVALDGVSLTLVDVEVDYFAVHLIPQTARETTLGSLPLHAPVNIETDPLAKHVRKQMNAARSGVTWEQLRGAGFGV